MNRNSDMQRVLYRLRLQLIYFSSSSEHLHRLYHFSIEKSAYTPCHLLCLWWYFSDWYWEFSYSQAISWLAPGSVASIQMKKKSFFYEEYQRNAVLHSDQAFTLLAIKPNKKGRQSPWPPRTRGWNVIKQIAALLLCSAFSLHLFLCMHVFNSQIWSFIRFCVLFNTSNIEEKSAHSWQIV